MEAVIGLDLWGFEHILGLRQGESEHATVVGELLSDLQSRGLSLDAPRLYVLDGSKALRQALDRYELQRYAGQLHMEAAFRDAYDERATRSLLQVQERVAVILGRRDGGYPLLRSPRRRKNRRN